MLDTVFHPIALGSEVTVAFKGPCSRSEKVRNGVCQDSREASKASDLVESRPFRV